MLFLYILRMDPTCLNQHHTTQECSKVYSRIQVRIQMNHRNRPINRLQRPQNRQHYRMVPSQTNNPGMFPLRLVRGGVVQDLSVSLFHLFEGVGCVERRYRDVTAVDLLFLVLELTGKRGGVLFPNPHRMDQLPRRCCNFGLSFRERILRGYPVGRNERRGGRTWKYRRGSLGGRYRGAGLFIKYSVFHSYLGLGDGINIVLTLSWEAARQRCHSRWANVTGCEKGRSTSRSVGSKYDRY